ncbi:MAG: lytic murein transglycosylase, partial [Pseudolabrys sp.]
MIIRVSLIAALIVAVLATPTHAADAAFRQWLTQQWPAAQALGVSRATFDTATRGLEPDLSLPDLAIPGQAEKAPQQPEFV